MVTTYYPQGVCARQMDVEVENGIVKTVNIIGGCRGNTQGLARLVEDMPAQDAIRRMRGILCGMRPTSCPDQLANAIERAAAAEK